MTSQGGENGENNDVTRKERKEGNFVLERANFDQLINICYYDPLLF